MTCTLFFLSASSWQNVKQDLQFQRTVVSENFWFGSDLSTDLRSWPEWKKFARKRNNQETRIHVGTFRVHTGFFQAFSHIHEEVVRKLLHIFSQCESKVCFRFDL